MVENLNGRDIKVVGTIEEAVLVTHGGTFHLDECMTTAILSYLIPGNGPLTVFRENGNRDIPDFPGQIVYDVGGGKFDHHQKGGNGARENGIPYAACGLIWKEFGMLLCEHSEDPEMVFTTVDRELIQPIDAHDCGYRNPLPEGFTPTPVFSLSAAIASFNPTWEVNEPALASAAIFPKAVYFARQIFYNVLMRARSKAKAKKIVYDNILESQDGIMRLARYVPWEQMIFVPETAPEELKKKAAEILYVVYPGNRGGFQFRAVPKAPGSFEQRNNLPEAWRGLKGDALRKVTGVQTATFVHPAGFIGGAEDSIDCLQLAMMAIEQGTLNT